MKLLSAAPARLLLSGVLAVSVSGGVDSVDPTTAQAAPVAPVTISAAPSLLSASSRAQAVRLASSRRGSPYRWGATGPRAFDCSGLTSWTFRRVGKRLPRTAHAQYRASRKISRRSARPGDLVFYGGRHKYHVGIYAGNGRMWHAPRRGDVVKLSRVRRGASYGRF